MTELKAMSHAEVLDTARSRLCTINEDSTNGEFYRGVIEIATAQPVIPEQPEPEFKIGTSKNAWPYYVAQCPKCGWLGSSADCLDAEESCDCPLCYADADEVDAETAFNVMLSAINELRASTAQPVSEYKPSYRDGLIAAARWVEKQREAYDSEHVRRDPDTGAFEFGNDAQRDYSSTLEEIAEGILGLVWEQNNAN